VSPSPSDLLDLPATHHLTPAWAVTLALLVIVVVALETGYRVGRHWPQVGSVSALRTTALGLATLLLAFSFSLSEARFDERRLLAVKEANAIGTLYMRAGYLPPALRDGIRFRFRRYVEVRINAYQAAGDRSRLAPLLNENSRLQAESWNLLEDHAAQLSPAVLLLVTNALNDVIDVSGERWASAQTRLPWLVLWLLLTVIFASALIVGYQPEAKRRAVFQWILFTVVMVTVMFTLVDLDRPTLGFIRTSLQPLIDLRDALHSP
jgi:hypothetical protein